MNFIKNCLYGPLKYHLIKMGGWGMPNDNTVAQNLIVLLGRFDYRVVGWGQKMIT